MCCVRVYLSISQPSVCFKQAKVFMQTWWGRTWIYAIYLSPSNLAWNALIVSEQTLHNIPKHNVFQINIQPISCKNKVTSLIGDIICEYGSRSEKMLDYKINTRTMWFTFGVLCSPLWKEKLLECLGKCFISLIITLANINRTLNLCEVLCHIQHLDCPI